MTERYDRLKYYETIAAALEQSPSVMAGEAAAAIRNLAARLTDEEQDNASYRARLATMQNRLDAAKMDVLCGNVETEAGLERAEKALHQIKALVTGDKNQRWLTETAVTSTRAWIADLCDAALAAAGQKPAPASAISGGEMVNVPRDALQTLIEQADAMAFERNTQDYEQFGRPQYIEDAYGWLAALAAAGQKP